jgi:hypothetical protein
VCALSAQESKELNGCGVVFKTTKPSFLLGEPVILMCEVENRTEGTMDLDFGADWVDAFDFELAIPHAEAILRDPHLQSGRSGKVRVEIRETCHLPIVLDRFLALNRAGSYNLKCTFRMGEQSVICPLTLKIDPEDGAKLRTALAAMIDVALKDKRKDMEEYYVIKTALPYVHSRAAIPELLRAAQMGLEDAVEALRRIGGSEATAALEQLTKSQNEEIAARAKSQLALMKMAEEGVAGIPK